MGDLSVSYSVPLIPQPTGVSCWAASLAMLTSYRDNASYAPESIAQAANMDVDSGYGWSQIQNAVSTWGLNTEGPACGLPDYWATLLSNHGPVWIVEVGNPNHAVVVVGVNGDGTMEGTSITLNNPWPPNAGVVETKSFQQFESDFEWATANAQIVYQ